MQSWPTCKTGKACAKRWKTFSLRSSRFRFFWAKRGEHERRARALGKKEQKSRFLLLFAQCPRVSFVLAPLGLKETETTATQARKHVAGAKCGKTWPVPSAGKHVSITRRGNYVWTDFTFERKLYYFGSNCHEILWDFKVRLKKMSEVLVVSGSWVLQKWSVSSDNFSVFSCFFLV